MRVHLPDGTSRSRKKETNPKTTLKTPGRIARRDRGVNPRKEISIHPASFRLRRGKQAGHPN
jgi:hypothetical protein